MKDFIIPVSWQVSGFVRLQAESAEEALRIAEDNEYDLPLTQDSNYIDGSYSIDGNTELVELYTNLYNKNELRIVPELFELKQ